MAIQPSHDPGSDSLTTRSHNVIRALCMAVVVIQVPFGIGFFRESTWATELWPFPDVRMTYIFIASIIATTATLFGWVAWRNQPAALRAPAIVAVTATPPIGLYMIWLGRDRAASDLTVAGIIMIAAGAATVVLAYWGGRSPVTDRRPLPRFFRWSFAGFCAILIPIGGALVLRVEGAFPWQLEPENSTVVGVIFLSAAALFVWIIANPLWVYGEMALCSFLAYDIVLFGPYLDLFRNRDDASTVASYYGPDYQVAEGDRGVDERGLILYLAVLAASAVLALVFFIWGMRSRAVDYSFPAD